MSFFPETPKDFVTDEEEYDVIVVGSGVASMVASTYLTDKNKKILVLEK